MNNTERKAHYGKKGLYNGYDRKNKEREALDYYSTPTEEVFNILDTIKLPLEGATMLEPCADGGHMLNGIMDYIKDSQISDWSLLASDIKERENYSEFDIATGKEYDFLSDNYPFTQNIDYIIMNPPYSVIEPFVMKALSIADKGVLMLGRLQFLKGEKRFESILRDCPPTDVWTYVDRIACYRNGDTTIKSDSAQAYAWFYWDLASESQDTKLHWIRRYNKR